MTAVANLIAERPELGDWGVLVAYRGSIAHGMYEGGPDSIDDKDLMAFCVPRSATYIGLDEFGSRGTVEHVKDEWDVVTYELTKAIRLLLGGNPNVLAMLWVPENYVITQTDTGRALRVNRRYFVGRHVYKPFVGYAKSQLDKMTASQEYRGYMGARRKALVDRFGYDVKNAAHLIRLLRMGIEFLRDGELVVDRGGYDATELLAIKHGEWSLARAQEEAARLFRRAEDAYDRSTLPIGPDRDAVARLCEQWIRDELRRRGEL